MLQAWVVWLLPLASAPFVPVVSYFDRLACRWFAVGVSCATAAVGLYQALAFSEPYTEGLRGWSIYRGVLAQVQVDGLSVLLTAFISVLSFVIVVYAAGNMREESGQARFYSLMLVFIGAMLGLVMAGTLLQLYLFWEVVGICSALLIAFWTGNAAARRAGMKAFLVTRVGDIALLVAVVTLLATLGTTSITQVNASVGSAGVNWVLIGFLLLIGAMGKSAQVPFHVWLPDAMEGPTPVSALIHAATMVNAGVYLLVRMSPVLAYSSLVSGSALVVGIVSLFVGAACASVADDLKRVLAYSTISQLGLMFAAVGMGSQAGAIYQLIGQGLFKALAFMAAGSVIEALGTRKLDMMGDLAGRMKYTYVAFLAAMLAMAGFPPLVGFWTKEVVLSAALAHGGAVFALIALASVLTSFYSFRALMRVFHGTGRGGVSVAESGRLMVAPMVALVALVAVAWVVLNGQGIFLPPLSESVSVTTVSATAAALLVGFATCYLAYQARPGAPARMVSSSGLLRGAVQALSEGLGFDRLYSAAFVAVTAGLSSLAVGLQTGDLRKNVAMLFALLVVLLALAVAGVL